MSNEENQQPEHVSINTSTSESSSSSSSSEIPTKKGCAFSVSGKKEAFRARARMEAQRKIELSSKSLFDNDSTDNDSSDDDLSYSNAAQPKTVKGQGLQAPHGKNFAFQHRFGMLPTAKNRTNNSIPRRLDTKFKNHYIFPTLACYKLPKDMCRLRSIITDFLMDVPSQRSGTSMSPYSESYYNSLADVAL